LKCIYNNTVPECQAKGCSISATAAPRLRSSLKAYLGCWILVDLKEDRLDHPVAADRPVNVITKVAGEALANPINQVRARYRLYTGQTSLYSRIVPYSSVQLLNHGRTLDPPLQQVQAHSSDYSILPMQTLASVPYSRPYWLQRPLSVRGRYQLQPLGLLVMALCI
jgi:hypothetical protein